MGRIIVHSEGKTHVVENLKEVWIGEKMFERNWLLYYCDEHNKKAVIAKAKYKKTLVEKGQKLYKAHQKGLEEITL